MIKHIKLKKYWSDSNTYQGPAYFYEIELESGESQAMGNVRKSIDGLKEEINTYIDFIQDYESEIYLPKSFDRDLLLDRIKRFEDKTPPPKKGEKATMIATIVAASCSIISTSIVVKETIDKTDSEDQKNKTYQEHSTDEKIEYNLLDFAVPIKVKAKISQKIAGSDGVVRFSFQVRFINARRALMKRGITSFDIPQLIQFSKSNLSDRSGYIFHIFDYYKFPCRRFSIDYLDYPISYKIPPFETFSFSIYGGIPAEIIEQLLDEPFRLKFHCGSISDYFGLGNSFVLVSDSIRMTSVLV